MQAGDPFDKAGWAAKINIIVLFFCCKASAQTPFFLLVLREKVEVEAETEALGKVGV